MRSYHFRSATLLLGFLIAACSDPAPTAPPISALRSNTTIAGPIGPLAWHAIVGGTTLSGARYAMYQPDDWNGDVVYFAHGYVAPGLPVELPTEDAAPIREALGARKFAVAYSSYSENGYAFADGLQQTHDLQGIFAARFGQPQRSFLIGQSMGSQIVQGLVERYPQDYNGALALCGLLGGTRMATDYIAHIRTLFDFFYPGVLPGTTITMPPITDPNTQIVTPAFIAISTDPNGFGAIASLDQGVVAGRNATEMVTTMLNVLAFHATGLNDILGRAQVSSIFDNSATTYASDVLPPSLLEALNAGVSRFMASPAAAPWLAHNYEPSGNLTIPMITVHKRFDRLVPFAHEAAYKRLVDAAGRQAMLRQRTSESYGHCDLDLNTEVMSNFDELVTWVNSLSPARVGLVAAGIH